MITTFILSSLRLSYTNYKTFTVSLQYMFWNYLPYILPSISSIVAYTCIAYRPHGPSVPASGVERFVGALVRSFGGGPLESSSGKKIRLFWLPSLESSSGKKIRLFWLPSLGAGAPLTAGDPSTPP